MVVTTIADVLNSWNTLGVFSYVIPFLLLFAVVFAILDKSKVLGDNKTVGAIVAAAVGLLALQFDFVSKFFAVIFPRFGVGISVFIVLLIMLGFFYPHDENGRFGGNVAWIGWVVGIGVALWSFSSWGQWSGSSGVGGWLSDNMWAIIVLAILVTLVIIISRSGDKERVSGGTPSPAV